MCGVDVALLEGGSRLLPLLLLPRGHARAAARPGRRQRPMVNVGENVLGGAKPNAPPSPSRGRGRPPGRGVHTAVAGGGSGRGVSAVVHAGEGKGVEVRGASRGLRLLLLHVHVSHLRARPLLLLRLGPVGQGLPRPEELPVERRAAVLILGRGAKPAIRRRHTHAARASTRKGRASGPGRARGAWAMLAPCVLLETVIRRNALFLPNH